MKIAYLGKIQLSDTDLPYLHEAQQLADITYIMEVTPRFMKGPAYDIKEIFPRSGIFKAIEAYPEFKKLEGFIDLNKFYVVNTCGRLWQLKSFWTQLLLLFFLVRQHFSVIHLVWPPNIYEFWIYALCRKMILTVHDPFPHSGLDTFIVRLRRKVAFAIIPRFIILNKTQKEDFSNYYGIAPERIITAQLSCCTYLHTVEEDASRIDTSKPYILFSGKISQYKGLDYLLPAMEKVHRQCPDCRLIVAGGGKFHFDISRYETLDFIDIRNRFILDSELVALIRHSDFMVCPYTDATQSGVIMSAFAFSKPVIATNVGALPEMVGHNRHGLIIKERDTDALANAIITLWRSPELRATYTEHIDKDYSNGELSWKNTARQLNAIYLKWEHN